MKKLKLLIHGSATMVLLFSLAFASCQNTPAKGGKVSVDEFENLISGNQDLQLIDVRTPDEFESGHIKSAVNIDINSGDFEQRINSLNKSKPVFVYCLSGGRSSGAAGYMRKNGFSLVYEMPGIIAWRNAGKPLESGNITPMAKGLNTADFNKMVSQPKYVLVDFNAVWCKPCKQLTPILEKITTEKSDKLILVKIDADENPELLKEKGNFNRIEYKEVK